ncbi:MAG: ABC transporter permease [Chloroflexi bacterium]|nr:ABC transporter permease [Chloroflexota bacterium]
MAWNGGRSTGRGLRRHGTVPIAIIVTLAVAMSVGALVVAGGFRATAAPTVMEGDKLRAVYEFDRELRTFGLFSYPEVIEIRERCRGNVATAAVGGGLQMTATLPESVGRATVAVVSGNYFDVLGTPALEGRVLSARDDVEGASPVIVLAEGAWNDLVGGSPEVVGERVQLGASSYVVVGVAGNPLAGQGYDPDVWIPLSQTGRLVPGGDDVFKSPAATWLNVVGRLRAGSGQGELETCFQTALEQVRGVEMAHSGRGAPSIVALPANRLALGPERYETTQRLLLMLGLLAAGFLVATCGTVVGLMVARGLARADEFAIRAALGATRADLVLLAVREIPALVAAASAVAVVVMPLTARIVGVPELADVALTARLDRYAVGALAVVALTVAVILGGGTVAGFASTGRTEGRVAGAGRTTPGASWQQVLVGAQVALSCVLMVNAGLLARSAYAVGRIELGFARDVLVADVTPREGLTEREGAAFFERLRRALMDRPEVSAVGLAWHAPLSEGYLDVQVEAPGSAVSGATSAAGNIISPGYFEALGVRVWEGRTFAGTEGVDGLPVAIVNRAFAERWWPGGSSIDQELVLPRLQRRVRVIGVVDNLRYRTPTEPLRPVVYLPLSQRFQPWVSAFIQTPNRDPMSAVPVVRAVAAEVDPLMGIGNARLLERDVATALAEWRGPASVAVVLAVLTLLLALAGVYALANDMVNRRMRELAVRRALGADEGEIRGRVLGAGLRPAIIGAVVGLVGAITITPYVEGWLYGVGPRDWLTLGGSVGLVGLTVWLGSVGPAQRAARASVMTILKAE